MEPIYVYLTSARKGEVSTKEIARGINIDRLVDTGEPFGIEIIDPIDVEVNGMPVRQMRFDFFSNKKSLQLTRQVSERREAKRVQALQDLRAATEELHQWRSRFGETALRDHLLEVSRLRAHARAEVVLPADAAEMILSFLTGWVSARGDGQYGEDELHDLAIALVESLEEVNQMADLDRAAREPDTAKVWRVNIEVPAHIGDGKRDQLFTALADALHGWEPQDRVRWDSFMSAHLVDPTNRVPSVDEVQHAIAVLASVPHCAYVGSVTGAECIAPVGRPGAFCEDHTQEMTQNIAAMAEVVRAAPEVVDREGDAG